MSREARREFDVLVVGGGPAGIAAAVSAAQSGKRVGIVDDNPAFGGQIWRGESAQSDMEAMKWIRKLQTARIELLSGVRVFDQPGPHVLRAETADGLCELAYQKVVLATGARERFLPFPGWTLPNVTGAGALQALVKSGLPINGKRVVVAGTGPLLLAVAAYLRKRGAEIHLICEQTSHWSLASFAARLLRYPGKISQALSLRKELSGIPLITGSWPIAAEGNGVLEAVLISRGGMSERIACDYLACGFHLVPNTELASLLGCALQNGYVQVDEFQRTSTPEVSCAGEPTGIGGVELSLVQGEVAGFAAAGQESSARRLFARRRKLRAFAEALESTFKLRSELKQLALPLTVVCRCEDVTYGQLTQHTSWRAAKLQTRCGMGPCQGRICGPATQFFFDWKSDSVRPPIFPAMLKNLAAGSCKETTEQTLVT